MRTSLAKEALTSLLAMLVFTVALGLIFPLALTGIAQVAFNNAANGSQVTSNGKIVGSKLIAQPFTVPVLDAHGKQKVDADGNDLTKPDVRYFQPRPSQTGYSPAGTSFNNAGPNNLATRDMLVANVEAYLQLESPYNSSLNAKNVPVDAVAGSASGVDPHISRANARIQAARVASRRGFTPQRVVQLIDANTDGRWLGLIGEPGVNVLKLNLALDKEGAR
ncbi:MAG: potassium-transporting ATPase subunit C [Solirubrobacterales bacterium]